MARAVSQGLHTVKLSGLKWCRLDIAAGDWHAVKAGLKSAAELCENGGDWERKNRLKVYDATFRLATRDLAGAANLFLDSIATFTSCVPSTHQHFALH